MIRTLRSMLLSCATAGLCLTAVQCDVAPGGLYNAKGTGSLRVLITDKPFPYDMIDQAIVTITKVDIRRTGSEVCETGCDDGLFCNGAELCVDGECRDGMDACGEDEVCNEDTDTCATPCEGDDDCDDTVFCNGAETCDTESQLCQTGAPECASGMFCDEGDSSCSELCNSDDQCNDGLFCNGQETCDAGVCLDGEAPVCDEGETCNDELGQCASDTDDSHGSPFVVIFEGEREFNLLDLQNGRTDLLAEATSLPAGNYNLMRVYVTKGTITLKDYDGEFCITVPSGAQTGIKLHFDFEIGDGEETTLLLDVDLSRAFRAIPSGSIDDPSTIRTFHFSPSIAMRLINLMNTGDISGTVTTGTGENETPLGFVAVTAVNDDGDEVTTSGSDADDGTYVLAGLPPGVYTVVFELDGYADVTVDNVTVTTGATAENVDANMVASP